MKKNVLITGTSTGIGRCTAILLAENGFKVYAGVRTEKDFASLASENENIKPIYIDVLDKASISKAVQLLKEEAVELTAIINNAGAVVAQPIECINIDDLKYQFELNTVAPVAIAQAFLPLMKSGKIINLSSMASTGMFPYISPYCASKRALDILFNSLSIEMKNKNIQVVSIKPGVIRTPIWNKSIATNRSQLEKLPDNFKEKYGKDLIFLAKNARVHNLTRAFLNVFPIYGQRKRPHHHASTPRRAPAFRRPRSRYIPPRMPHTRRPPPIRGSLRDPSRYPDSRGRTVPAPLTQ